jgi:hypothetical protein
MSEHVYRPSPWGEIYHNYPVDELLGAGSAGPGKTEVLLNDANSQIYVEHRRCEDRDHPFPLRWGESVGWALHLRRTVPQLGQTIVRSHRIFPRIDPKAKWMASDNTWLFSSGYRYQFGHCKDPDDWENYYSNEYTWLGFDEVIQFLEEQYDQIRTRLRSSDPVLSRMLKCRSMSNPIVKKMRNETFMVRDPLWVRRRFVDPAPEGKKVLKRRIVMEDGSEVWRTRMYLPATLWDNPNKQFVRDYEVTLQEAKPYIRQALLYGNWYATADSFYGDVWNPQLHICNPFRIPDEWPRFRSMDWGFKTPGCIHWYAMDEDKNVFVFRELTFKEKTDVEVAKMVREIEFGMGLWQNKRSLLSGPADTQLWEEKGESGRTKAQAMGTLGVYWNRADKKSRQHNAEHVVSRLKDHHSGKTTPGLVIFNTCRDLIRTLPAIQTMPGNVECPDNGGDDHWHDSLLYGIAYASRGRVGVPKTARVKQPWEIEDEDDKVVNDKRRGQLGYGI